MGTTGVVANEGLDQLFEDYRNYEMEQNPFAATAAGDHRFNNRVPDVSAIAQSRRLDARKKFQKRLQTIVGLSGLTSEDQLSAQVLGFILQHDIELAEFAPWRIPFVSDSGFHTEFGYVISATPFRTENDYLNYLLRLTALPDYLQQNINNLRIGLEDGFTQPKEIMEFVFSSFEAQVVEEIENHPAYAPFKSMPDSIQPDIQATLEREAWRIVEQEVNPANRQLVEFMRSEYLPAARETLGASGLPQGKAYYSALVRYFTTLDDATSGNIHQRGLEEVARIRGEMDAVIEETKFEGSFEEFLTFLRTDPQFYAKAPDELLKQASWIAKQTDGRLPAFFGKLPRQPYSVEPVPAELAPNYTGGRYSPAPPGSSRGGQYWVNTYALDTRSLYQLTALSLHEGVPGHHLQIALAAELEGVPEFRKDFYPHAFGEGWGLYAEKLGVEMGIYETPYDHFGRLSYEMWRACRLVVDTGMHAKGWTRQQAIDYLAENTALSFHEINTEIDRYIAWPGQALAYKMGELTLWELRSQAKEALGDKFDIREFHDAVLAEGGIPLEVLRSQIARYIEDQKNVKH